jgi:hypothetical protein
MFFWSYLSNPARDGNGCLIKDMRQNIFLFVTIFSIFFRQRGKLTTAGPNWDMGMMRLRD